MFETRPAAFFEDAHNGIPINSPSLESYRHFVGTVLAVARKPHPENPKIVIILIQTMTSQSSLLILLCRLTFPSLL